jgi:RimJ/RimL family protein N-acetyltransferase
MKRPERVTLSGRYASIVPVDPAAHAAGLFAGSRDDELWRYLMNGPWSSEAELREYLEGRKSLEDPLFFTILDAAREPAGYCSLMRIEPVHGSIEIGNILYLSRFQRTAGATEAMYLMAQYGFEALGARRYEWKCDSRNQGSRRAALRLGFRFEGIFRQHMMVKGENRDTAWYSMLDREWPERKRAFEAWLAPGNFDPEGRQRRPLERAEELWTLG